MSSSDTLFDLIHRLSKSEKAYFKKIKMAFSNKDSALQELYNALNNTESYNKENVLKKIKNENLKKHFIAKKSVLLGEILDVLAYSKQKQEKEWEIEAFMARAKILEDKNLLIPAYKTLQKAYKTAWNQEDFERCLTIKKREFTLNKMMLESIENVQDDSLNILKEQKELSKLVANKYDFLIISDKLRDAVGGDTYSEIEVQKLLNSPLLKNESSALSNYTKGIFLHNRYIIERFIKNDPFKSAIISEELIKFQNQHNGFSIQGRLNTIFNYVVSAADAYMTEKVKTGLQWFKELAFSSDSQLYVLEYFLTKGTILVRFNQYEELVPLFVEYEEVHKQLLDNEFPEKQKELELMVVLISFYNGEYKKTLRAIYYYLNSLKKEDKKNSKLQLNIILIICALESNELDLYYSLLRSLKRKRRELDQTDPNLIKIIDLINDLFEGKETAYLQIEQHLTQMEKNYKTDTFGILIKYFKVTEWIRARLKGITFKERIKELKVQR